MTSWRLFTSAWDWEPSVIAGTALLLAGYLVAVRFRFERTTFCFLAGGIVMFLALVSPLDALGDDYLFSAHMLQHILLDLLAPLLFVLGLSRELAQRIVEWPVAAGFERILRRPWVAWPLGIGTLWAWHLPALYDATLASETVHVIEHLSFLVTGTILWWPVFSPLEPKGLSSLPGVAYLVAAALANGLLGAIFTIASTPFYPAYLHPTDELHALSLIRRTWGLDPVSDQQLGGAFMWVLGSLIFLCAILILLARWFRHPDPESERPSANPDAPARANWKPVRLGPPDGPLQPKRPS